MMYDNLVSKLFGIPEIWCSNTENKRIKLIIFLCGKCEIFVLRVVFDLQRKSVKAKDSIVSPQHNSKAVTHFVVLILFCTM